ncbi:MAG: hypothetical protein KJ622_16590 [Alphaproteobacteria bacterium]|nr:hypothetical protein [Alphaproteobacteria bacterium]
MIPGDLIMSVIEERGRQLASSFPVTAGAGTKPVAAVSTVREQGHAHAVEANWQAEIERVGATMERSGAVRQAALERGAGLARSAPKPQSAEIMVQGLLLQSVVEVMLSNQGEALTGKGTAGRMWRSMLAEHIAAEVGSSLDLRLLPGVKNTQRENSGAQPEIESGGVNPARQA